MKTEDLTKPIIRELIKIQELVESISFDNLPPTQAQILLWQLRELKEETQTKIDQSSNQSIFKSSN